MRLEKYSGCLMWEHGDTFVANCFVHGCYKKETFFVFPCLGKINQNILEKYPIKARAPKPKLIPFLELLLMHHERRV